MCSVASFCFLWMPHFSTAACLSTHRPVRRGSPIMRYSGLTLSSGVSWLPTKEEVRQCLFNWSKWRSWALCKHHGYLQEKHSKGISTTIGWKNQPSIFWQKEKNSLYRTAGQFIRPPSLKFICRLLLATHNSMFATWQSNGAVATRWFVHSHFPPPRNHTENTANKNRIKASVFLIFNWPCHQDYR